MNDQCSTTDLQYGGKIYAYAPVDENGEPITVEMDVDDAQEALADAQESYYYCRNCGEEWHDFKEAKKHYEVSHAEAQTV